MRANQLKSLQTADGERLLNTIREKNPTEPEALALISRLRRDWDAELVSAAMTMHRLRSKADGRLKDADRLWLTADGLEQASSSSVADHRAARFAGSSRVADLCCGVGGDLMALARRTDIDSFLAVDRDPLHAAMAEANARIVRPDIDLTTIVGDVEAVDLGAVDGVFIDPARRHGGQRVGHRSTSPQLHWAVELADHVARIGITVAPGFPHELVPEQWELEMVAVGPDLKEGMLWSPALLTASRRATVIDRDSGEVRSMTCTDGERIALVRPEAGMTIIDPNPAITRAGLVQELARLLDAGMIDDQIAFLVADKSISTPFGRSMRIVDSLPWHEREVKKRLTALDAGPIDIRRRGLAGDIDAITKRLRGKGARPLTVLMTRHLGNPWALIAETPPT